MRPGEGSWFARSAVLAALGLIGLAYFWRFGYVFGASDHDELLPPVLALLDNTLFRADWYVQLQLEGFNVRTPFTWLLAALTAPLGLEPAVFVLYTVSALATLGGVYWLARELGAPPFAAAAGTVAATVLTSTWTLGGNAVLYPQLVPEQLGWALILPAVVLVMKQRLILAAALIGIAAWFQVLAAALTAVSLGLALLAYGALGSDRTLLWRTVVHFGLVALAIAAPFVLLVGLAPLATVFPDHARLSSFYVIAELRLPHHYLPLSFGVGRYARFLGICLVGGAAAWWMHRSGRLRHGRMLAHWFGACALMALLAFILIESFESLFAAKLQVFKLTVLLQTILTIISTMAVAHLLPDDLGRRLDLSLQRPWVMVPAVIAACVLTVLLVVAGFGRPGSVYQPRVHAASDLHDVERWAAEETEPDALFSVPPSNTTFRTYAQRSVVITFKPTPFQDELMHTWIERLLKVAPARLPVRGVDFLGLLDEAYHDASWSHRRHLRTEFDADFVLVDLERTETAPPVPPAYRAGRWAVYALTDPTGEL
jgi:hypothetical protein